MILRRLSGLVKLNRNSFLSQLLSFYILLWMNFKIVTVGLSSFSRGPLVKGPKIIQVLGGNMKKRIRVLFYFFMSLGISSLAFAEMPGPDAEALWRYISETSPYTSWGFWPDHQGVQPGRAPHGPLHKVYVNDRGLSSARPPVQYGTIAVKENYGKDMELKAITVMYKSHGFNPDAGDWYWVKYSPEGKAGPSGKPAGCVGCHGTRAKNDFVLVHEFK